FCYNCGQQLVEGAKFCSACGTKIVNATPTP
ncbi:MAG: zinc-ribbon domain-containing protein, partial [Alistipes sp.]|nr:zinc-ribbon domain-containing protein [Alistipes sp.]